MPVPFWNFRDDDPSDNSNLNQLKMARGDKVWLMYLKIVKMAKSDYMLTIDYIEVFYF